MFEKVDAPEEVSRRTTSRSTRRRGATSRFRRSETARPASPPGQDGDALLQAPAAERRSGLISVIVPVKNGGIGLGRCLRAIVAQRVADHAVEIVVVDSGSDDGSGELARSCGARVYQIAPEDFDHGATRNLGARMGRGDILVFTTQDAYATSSDWLSCLIAPLADPTVAGVYGRQMAHLDAHPPETYFLDFLYGSTSRTQRAGARHELSMQTTMFSNVASAIRRDVFDASGFVEGMIMSEDQEWAVRMLLAGYTLRYAADAVVRHSHPYSLSQAFRRFFDSGVSAEQTYLAGARPSAQVLRQEAMRYARGELSWLWRSGNVRWLPYAAVYEGTKFSGLQIGARHHRLPRPVARFCSATPSYWGHRAPRRSPELRVEAVDAR